MPRTEPRSSEALRFSATSWFVCALIGQWAFVVYILGLYVRSSLAGNLEAPNEVLPHGYENGNLVGNLSLSAHLYVAAFISFVGPLQLIPKIRTGIPMVHRWLGRAYMLAAFVMSCSGMYLILSGRELVGDLSQYIAIFINALLILVCGACALNFALRRNFARHRRWALRLFLAVSGVWLFRVGFMFWVVVNGGPVGFDPKSFSGPFLTALAFLVYVFPIAVLEVYLRARDSRTPGFRWLTAFGLLALTLKTGVGVFGAIVGMWLPRISG